MLLLVVFERPKLVLLNTSFIINYKNIFLQDFRSYHEEVFYSLTENWLMKHRQKSNQQKQVYIKATIHKRWVYMHLFTSWVKWTKYSFHFRVHFEVLIAYRLKNLSFLPEKKSKNHPTLKSNFWLTPGCTRKISKKGIKTKLNRASCYKKVS